jgi:flagellar basal-body rod modification protein FlgD
MATAPIGSATELASAASARLKLDDLLRVLLTELTHQNPFKPVDNKDFMAQIAQFASLDSSLRLNTSIEQLIALQAVNQSVGLIGRVVSANTDQGVVNGRVTALSLTGGVPRMTIAEDGGNGRVFTNIAIGDLQTIR